MTTMMYVRVGIMGTALIITIIVNICTIIKLGKVLKDK